jgi:predicted CoA-substrate-specific enzyme activase
MSNQDINSGNKTSGIVIGVDIGSAYSKAVAVNNTQILTSYITPSIGAYAELADNIIKNVLQKIDKTRDDVAMIVATGYGANSVNGAIKVVSEITAQGTGVSYLHPSVRTIADIGGQFTRVFRINEEGNVINFVVSEKCASGSGKLLQLISRVLQVDVADMGELSQKAKNVIEFTTSCAVFNESEVISRIAEGALKEDIVAGIHRALASRVHTLIERIGLEPDWALIGGGAKNKGLVLSIEERIGNKALVYQEPQIVAALGAALTATA